MSQCPNCKTHDTAAVAMVCEVCRAQWTEYPSQVQAEIAQLRNWRAFAYAHLGAVRHHMSPAEVLAVQNWLEGVYSYPLSDVKPPYPFCRHPDKCAGKGYCPRDPTCAD